MLKLVKIQGSEKLLDLLKQQAEDNGFQFIDLLARLEKGKVTQFVKLILEDYYST